MARPAMSAKVTAKHLTTSEKNTKIEIEEKLKGSSDELSPPEYLSETQVNIFNYIVDNLTESGILSNLDVYVLAECSIAIERMQYIEKRVNDNPDLLENSTLMATKDKYTKNFQRYCNELSLSPQSRAKIANINLCADNPSPLLSLLNYD